MLFIHWSKCWYSGKVFKFPTFHNCFVCLKFGCFTWAVFSLKMGTFEIVIVNIFQMKWSFCSLLAHSHISAVIASFNLIYIVFIQSVHRYILHSYVTSLLLHVFNIVTVFVQVGIILFLLCSTCILLFCKLKMQLLSFCYFDFVITPKAIFLLS